MKHKSKKQNKIIIGLKQAKMFAITNYDPSKYDKEILKKWCIEQANQVSFLNGDGMFEKADLIKTAQKIFDWVTK